MNNIGKKNHHRNTEKKMSTKITINHLDARLILHSRKIGLSTYQLLKAIHQGRIIQDIETGNYILKSHKK